MQTATHKRAVLASVLSYDRRASSLGANVGKPGKKTKIASQTADRLQLEIPNLAEKRLLSKILNESSPGQGTDAVEFRARNAAQLRRLDDLETQRWLIRKDDWYRLPLAALAVLGSSKSKTLVADAATIFRALVRCYRAEPRTPVRISSLAASCKLDELRVREALSYMLEAPWYGGHSTDLFSRPANETTVTPSEGVVRRPTWKAWLDERVRQRGEEVRAHKEWGGSPSLNTLQPSKSESDSLTRESRSVTVAATAWHRRLPPKLRHAYVEILKARENDLRWLAAIGLRGIVEIVAITALGSDVPTFKKKLELLHDSRYISDSDLRTLEAVIEVGNASAHRGHKPSSDDFEALLEIVEQLLRRLFILETAAARAKGKVPARVRAKPQTAA